MMAAQETILLVEDDPDEEDFLRGIRDEGDDRGFVLEALKDGVEVRTGRPWARVRRAMRSGIPSGGLPESGGSSARAVNISDRPSNMRPVSTACPKASTAPKFSEAPTWSSPGPTTLSR